MYKLSVLLLLVTAVTTVWSRSTHHHRMSKEMERAMHYLSQYNYMGEKNPDPKSASLMRRDPAEATRQGIQLFQRRNGLRVTGTMTDETEALMRKPRCGLPDINNMEQTRKKRFAVQGGTWPKNVLTYRISKYPQDGDMRQHDVDREIRRAFQVWEKVTPLRFYGKRTTDTVDIDIQFAGYDHGDGFPFDGIGGVLAHAFYPQYGGNAHFDESEVWTLNSHEGTNLFLVAAHEFGHALGLAHSSDPTALMAPFYSGYQPNFQLPDDDIRGIQQLYGPPKSGKETTPKTKPEITTTTSPPTHRPTLPPICTDGTFDAVTTHMEGDHKNVYAFHGDMYVQLVDQKIAPGYPRPIYYDWRGLPNNIDATLYWDAEYRNYWRRNDVTKEYDLKREVTKPARTYFFKGNLYWRFENRKMVEGYPKDVSNWGIPRDIDSAFVWSGNGKTYFTKGDKYYRYTKSVGVDSGYPRPLSVWKGLPSKIDAAFQYTNGKTYFFDGPNYYRFQDDTFKVDEGYPQLNTMWWLGCDSIQGGRVVSVESGSSHIQQTAVWISVLILIVKILL